MNMKSKSTSLTVRIAPNIKDALAAMAEAEHRSLTNMLEFIILERLKTHPAGEALATIGKKAKAR